MGLQITRNDMTHDKLEQANNLDSRIRSADYWLYQALRMQTCSHTIKIIESIPNGSQAVLAELSPQDKLIPIISELLIARLTNEKTTLETQFNNL